MSLLACTFMLAAVAAVARLAPMSVTLVAAADRARAPATAPLAGAPACCPAPARSNGSLSLSLGWRPPTPHATTRTVDPGH